MDDTFETGGKTKEEKLKERQEAAALTQKLLQASASGGGVAKSGKVVNAYGQEEVGISRREAKASALRDMYASSTEKGIEVKRRVAKKDKVEAYVPRSFNESKYEMGKCWGLSSSMPKNVKPLPRRSTEVLGQRRVPVPCLPPDEPRRNWLSRDPAPRKPLPDKKDTKKKKKAKRRAPASSSSSSDSSSSSSSSSSDSSSSSSDSDSDSSSGSDSSSSSTSSSSSSSGSDRPTKKKQRRD